MSVKIVTTLFYLVSALFYQIADFRDLKLIFY